MCSATARVPPEDQLRRRTRHRDGRSQGDRADLHVARAARVGADRGQRARPHHGCLALQAAHVRVGHERRACGARQEASIRRWPTAPVPRVARPARLHAAALGGTGGAALGPDTFKFFLAMGVPLRSSMARPSCSAPTCIRRARSISTRSASRWPTTIKIRIENPDVQGVGEIVIRHPYMFVGYYKNQAATRADLQDGWMHSGDAGYFNDSRQLVVIDRIRDLADLARRALLAAIHREQAQVLALYQRRPWCSAPAAIRSRR